MTVSLLFLVAAAFGQEAGQLSGNVRGPTGDPLPDVVLVLTPADGGNESSRAVSGSDGEFVFDGLSPGVYELLAVHAGYEDQKEANVVVSGSGETRLDLSLSLKGYTETVEIRGESPIVEKLEPAPPQTLAIEEARSSPPRHRPVPGRLSHAPRRGSRSGGTN